MCILYNHSVIRKPVLFKQATALRKRGFTYAEIAHIVGISKSTVSQWFAHEPWSRLVRTDNQRRAAVENGKRIALLNKARSNQYQKLYAEAARSASIEFSHYRSNPLFVAGLMLYVGEGDNTHPRLIRIANSRPDIHRIFIRFAVEFLGIPQKRIHFWLLLYPEHKPLSVSRYWSSILKIPISQFYKYQVIKGQSTKRRLQYGVGNTIIGSAVLKRKLDRWIEIMLKDLH